MKKIIKYKIPFGIRDEDIYEFEDNPNSSKPKELERKILTDKARDELVAGIQFDSKETREEMECGKPENFYCPKILKWLQDNIEETLENLIELSKLIWAWWYPYRSMCGRGDSREFPSVDSICVDYFDQHYLSFEKKMKKNFFKS